MKTIEEIKKETYDYLLVCGYSHDTAQSVADEIVGVARPGVVLVKNENCGLLEMYL